MATQSELNNFKASKLPNIIYIINNATYWSDIWNGFSSLLSASDATARVGGDAELIKSNDELRSDINALLLLPSSKNRITPKEKEKLISNKEKISWCKGCGLAFNSCITAAASIKNEVLQGLAHNWCVNHLFREAIKGIKTIQTSSMSVGGSASREGATSETNGTWGFWQWAGVVALGVLAFFGIRYLVKRKK